MNNEGPWHKLTEKVSEIFTKSRLKEIQEFVSPPKTFRRFEKKVVDDYQTLLLIYVFAFEEI